MDKLKILFFDIETAPNLAYIWGKYEQNAIAFENEWYIMSASIKWLGSKKTITYKLDDYKKYKKNKLNDLELCKDLWKILNEADIVIGHNVDRFDIKKVNARFIYHNMIPPSSYKTIDTLKIAKKYFKFTSNKLNDLGIYLKLGKKIKHSGFDLWLGCMNGNKKSWKLMKKYNKRDITLLEKLYQRFKPYIMNHPNLGLYLNKKGVCPNCGSKDLMKHGFRYTKSRIYQRWQCKECGAESRSAALIKNNKPTLTN